MKRSRGPRSRYGGTTVQAVASTSSTRRRIRQAARAVLGPRRGDLLVNVVRDKVYRLAYLADERGRNSEQRLLDLRDRYAGQRCFIIGNGPSLNEMDLTPLRNEYTFALNRGYLLFERIGGPTTFLVAVNPHVIRQFARDLGRDDTQVFVSWHSRDAMQGKDVAFVLSSSGPRFCEDVARNGAWDGATVTYVALQLAFHMGFAEVYLIGVDHSFASSGQPHTLLTATQPDQNHFDPSYFGPGVQWQLPDLDTSELAYRLAREHFERAQRTVKDATIGGKLRVFEKVDYAGLFTGSVNPLAE